jgi:hypothetical protein
VVGRIRADFRQLMSIGAPATLELESIQ